MSSELRKTLALLLLALIIVLGAIWILRPDQGTDVGVDTPVAPAEGTVEERLAALRGRMADLRVAQDTFHRHYGVFGRSVDQMRFAVPKGMTIQIVSSSATGWAAQATIRGSDRMCAIFVGDSATWAFPPAREPGVPVCTP